MATYDSVAQESGVGSFVRMKQQMSRGVDQTAAYMYDQAAGLLQEELETLQVGDRALFQYKDCLYRNRESHYKYQMVVRMSLL